MQISSSLAPVYAMLTSLVSVIPITFFGKSPNRREFWTFLAATIKFLTVCSLVPWVIKGNVYELVLCQLLPGISLKLKVDGFGLVFALVASSLWIVTSLYSMGYMRGLKEHSQTRFFCYFAVALSATLGVAFSGNLLTMYLFYELLSLSTYPLVTHHQDEEARMAGRKYLTYLFGGSIGLALPAMIIVYMITGTLEFQSAGIFGLVFIPKLMPILLIMFLYGFGKAGIMPLHSWLPGAMVAPTPVSSLLHAVAVVKVGVFCIIRVLTGIFGSHYMGVNELVPWVCYIAGFTVIAASLIALYQDNLKRLLAFSTIGQLSYIVMGVGLSSHQAVMGGALHIVMHAFGKITLFFCAGAIYVATGKKYISQMKGYGRKMPWTFGAFFIGALSIIGFPPTGGFISKWMMLNGALDSDQIFIMSIYLVSSFLNACYFFPIIYTAFFKDQPNDSDQVSEPPLNCVIPPVITATISVILFFKHDFILQLLKGVF